MFSTNKKEKSRKDIDPGIIKKLVVIRASDYKIQVINQALNEKDYKEVLNLARNLVEEILKSNLIHSEGMEAFEAACAQFDEILGGLVNDRALVIFAAQLLQFYTITSHKDFGTNTSLAVFHDFLTNNSKKFGDTDNNPFITEYLLVKVYNCLVSNADSYDLSKGSIRNLERKLLQTNLKVITEELQTLKKRIDDWVSEASDNVFMHHLSFIHNYTSAKSLELQYSLQEKDRSLLADRQKIHLSLAKKAIDEIDRLSQPVQGEKAKYPQGLEFSLGRNLLHKLPETNLDEIKKHLATLLVDSSMNSCRI